MKRKPFFRPAAFSLLGFSSFSLAATVEQPLLLDEQVSTATRTSQDGIAATTVIDREQIERSQATSVPELLRRVPGVSLVNNGGPGKSTSVSLRGSNSNHVLVLIDGIRVGSATTGDVAFQNLPVELIERIEVVRGPRSGLYGSDAIGGVIQIFTRKGNANGSAKPFFSAGYGTHDSYSGSAGVSGGNRDGWYNLGVSSNATDGISARSATAGYEADADGYRELAGSFSGGYRFANGLELDGNLLQSNSHNDYDSGTRANADGVQKVAGARARYRPLERWLVTLQAGRSEDKNDTYAGSSFNTRIDTRRDSFNWQNDFSVASGQLLTLGYDHLHDEVNGTTAFREDSRDNDGLFGQYLASFGRNEWQFSLRRDRNEQFGNHTTGNLGWAFALSDALRFTSSYGSAFKAPTFNQFYHPVNGNPDLEAEKSRNLEFGLEGQHAWGTWSVNAFHDEIDNLIAYFNAGNGLRAYNIDKAVIRGVELSLAGDWFGWDWSTNATFQDPQNRSSRANQGDLLPRRAQQLFNLDLDRRFGRFGAGASLHAEGRRWDNAANTTDLHGFATVDLRGEYWLNPEWRLQAKVTNLLGAEYETAATYNQPGQAVYLVVRYQAL
ncbi:TonB-dependent vitamin B12 receptor [Pseudomonas sp.]|uniref:TonB-dependent vitamin B12 receptor n=1 Tax=Pseudomonas sp. TaxID=306 RepID=UPI0028A6E966|nr:TonB-dependent vitamin B12 receptor [Pseudomonas sp.]